MTAKFTTRYPHAETQAKYFALIAEHGHKNVEWKNSHSAHWMDTGTEPLWVPQLSYEVRLKPKTFEICQADVPAPEVYTPDYWAKIYIADTYLPDDPVLCYWNDSDRLVSGLLRGLIYLNREDAVAAAKAFCIREKS